MAMTEDRPARRNRSLPRCRAILLPADQARSEEHTSELQSRVDLVCRLLLEKKYRPGAVSPNSSLVPVRTARNSRGPAPGTAPDSGAGTPPPACGRKGLCPLTSDAVRTAVVH